MKLNNLPTLHNFITNGNQLRIEMAKALNQARIYGYKAGTLPASIAKLQALFDAADAELTAIKALPASVVLSASDVAMSVASDATEQLVVTKTPLSGSNSNVASDTVNTFYKSSDPAKLTVSATGLMTAVAPGAVTVTAYVYGKASNALAVTVAA